jgi:hypothetical protein
MLRVPNAVLFYFLFPFLVFPVEDNLVSLMEMGGEPPFFLKKKRTARDSWGCHLAREETGEDVGAAPLVACRERNDHFFPRRPEAFFPTQGSSVVVAGGMTNRLSWLPGRSWRDGSVHALLGVGKLLVCLGKQKQGSWLSRRRQHSRQALAGVDSH